MTRRNMLLSVLLALVLAPVAFCAEAGVAKKEDLSKKLEELDAKIKQQPDDPMLYYRKAQCLMAMKQYDNGYAVAQQAMKVFIKRKSDLAWMMLESIDLKNVRVDVHFNMGPRERKLPSIGIIKPLSFRIWSKGKDGGLLEIIDFEQGVMDGKPDTAALGQTTPQGHGNFGMLAVDIKYKDIRKKAIELIEKRHAGR